MDEPTYVTAIEEARAAFGVPGVSWALIEDGQIAEAGTSGVREAGGSRPVTDTTRFQACSTWMPTSTPGSPRGGSRATETGSRL